MSRGGFSILKPALEKESSDLAEYKDEGCEVFESCLSCPLPCCLEESRGGKKKFIKQGRDEQILDYNERGKTTAEIARLMGISQRTIQRVVAVDKLKGKATGG